MPLQIVPGDLFKCVLFQMDGWMGGWMDGWVGGWMDGWVGGWVDGWIGVCVCIWAIFYQKCLFIYDIFTYLFKIL